MPRLGSWVRIPSPAPKNPIKSSLYQEDIQVTIANLVEDCFTILDTANIQQAHFIGVSLGGLVAQAAATANESRVKSLILCASAAVYQPFDLWDGRINKVLQDGMEPMVEASITRWFTAFFIEKHPEKITTMMAVLRKVHPVGYACCCRVLRDTDLRQKIGQITKPVALIAGADDKATPPAKMEDIRLHIPNAALTILPHAAHILNVEQAQATTHIMRQFLHSLH